ncbi:MAG: FeoB-associated Cys-rich membrane protein [bacterium]
MSGLGAQDAVAALVALVAAAWLVRRALRRRAEGAGCEGCPSAEAGAPACGRPADALVTIGEGTASRPDAAR